MKYVAVWFPTIFHKELALNNKIHDEFPIDDKSDHTYWVTLDFNERNNSIDIKSTLTNFGKKEEFTVVLTEIHKSNNGFVIYECDEQKIEEKYRETFFSEDLLLKPIYHKIKEFYHTHEADKEKDSALKAQCGDKRYASVDEFLLKGDFLLNLLVDFETLFRASAETISDHNSKLQEKLEEYKNSKEKIETLIKETGELSRLCENALIEYTYCKTLLTSIYNKFFQHSTGSELLPADSDDEKTRREKETKVEYRRKALNIRNAIRYVENIKYKNQNRQNFIISEQNTILAKILKNGDRTQQIGLTLTVLGVVYALLFGYKSNIEKLSCLNFQQLLLIVSGSGLILLFLPYYYKLKKLFCQRK